MNRHPRSPVARWLERLLQSTLSFWPSESREWGRALAAEAAQIHGTAEAIRWALGGLAFFLRSVGGHLWTWANLPAGANSSSCLSGGEPPQLPKHSRLTTALLILGAAMLLLLPWGREAMAAVSSLWLSVAPIDFQRRDVENLAHRAEKDKDAPALALAAITHPDRLRGKQLASEAVRLDPSLTWIYTSNFGPESDPHMSSSWLAALSARNPENGFLFLIAANARAEAAFMALIESHTPLPGELEQALASDAEYLALMRQAVLAAKYDDYSAERRNFARDVWLRHPYLSPEIVIHSRWTLRFPDVMFVRAYATLQIQKAQCALARGEWQAAESSLSELRAFGTRLADTSQADIERLSGVEVSRVVLEALRSLYAAQNRASDVQSVDQSLAELQHRRAVLSHWDAKTYFARIRSYRLPAREVQFSAFLLFLGAFTAATSLAFLEVSVRLPKIRKRLVTRMACLSADYAPLLTLAAAIGLLLTFRPFAIAASQFRSGSGPFADDRFFAGVYYELHLAVFGQTYFLVTDYFWWFATIALSAAAIFITVRGLLRHRPA